MENKYYTPSIEEFHVGFECESTYCLIKDVDAKEEWVKHTFDDYNISYLLDAYTADAYPTEFRVKYLDKKDIESLGFIMNGSWEWSYHSEDGNATLIYTTNFSNKGKEIFISISTSFKDEAGIEIKFSGYIKNKSELKKLLKQLNIQ